jgi:predicted Zn-dependent peptidase
VAALALLAAPVTAVPAAAAPAPAAAIPEVPFELFRLDNGLQVILHVDRSVPLVAVDVWYHVGSGDETPGKSGFAHLFEHMMFQGARHIGRDAHFDILRRAGASGINGTTNPDRTNYFEVVPSHHFQTALWLESDRMGYMLDLLDEASLRNQIDVVRNERRQRYDNVPYGRERFAVAQALYPEGHPERYLTIGRHEDLEAASLADVRGFFQRWYAPSNATLVIAGDVDPAVARREVERWFGSFPTLERPQQVAPDTRPPAKTVRVELDDPFAQLRRVHYVYLGAEAYSEADAALGVVTGALAADGWGRLYRRLVAGERLAQRVSAYHVGKNHHGELHVVVDLLPGADQARAEAIVQEELDAIARAPVAAEELERVLAVDEASLVFGLEELLSRAELLQRMNHYLDDPGGLRTVWSTLRGLTPARIQAIAAGVLANPRVEVITRPAPAAAKGERAPGGAP